MYLKLVRCLCGVICFISVRSQRAWGPGGYNTGLSNSWSPSGFSNPNVGNWGLNRPNQLIFGSNQFNTPFGVNADRRPAQEQLSYGNVDDDTTDWNSDKPNGGISGSAFNARKPDGKKSASIINVPNTNTNTFSSSDNDNSLSQFLGSSSQNSKTNEWNSNNNVDTPQSNYFSTSNENNFSSFGSSRPSGTNSQNSKPNKNASSNINSGQNSGSFPSGSSKESSYWNKPSGTNGQNSNNFNDNNKPFGNDVDSENSVYSWNSNGKEKNKPNKNNRKTTTSKPTTSTNKPSNSNWDQIGNEKTQEESSFQNEKKTAADTSILDELDKNDWYFGKESNYPKPPFRSVLNIDVSELWNFDKNRKSSQSSKDRKNSNNSRRRNRQTGEAEGVRCECVSVSLCDEDDMIVAQEDVKYDWRPLEAFRCERLTEVCCTNPKLRFSSRANVEEEDRRSLNCGQRRIANSPFEGFRGNISEPGEFPWNLQLQNSEINCSASLIHPQLALTAAHCVTSMQPRDINLKAGIWNFNKEPPQIRKVSRIIPHPAYSSKNPRNDIALLVLENGFELNDNVNTICLPFSNDKWNSDRCLVAGWGLEEFNGEVVPVLEKGAVAFIPQPECQNIMLVTDLWRNYVLHDSFVCAREKGGSNACMESEGAPVICPSQKRADTYIQIGIVSKGMNCDDFGRPGIFTNVLQFLDWINQNHFDLGLNYDIDIRSL